MRVCHSASILARWGAVLVKNGRMFGAPIAKGLEVKCFPILVVYTVSVDV